MCYTKSKKTLDYSFALLYNNLRLMSTNFVNFIMKVSIIMRVGVLVQLSKDIKETFKQVRIRKATDLIKTTDMTMLEIAFYCGFADANYFSRTFKKYMGVTPTSIRGE